MTLLVAAACALLSPADIQRVQGERPALAKASDRGGGTEQCFFQLPTFSRSVSLEVTRGPAAADLWRKTFEGAAEADEEGEKAKPERVRGLGKEAYFAGGARIGGLYVRTGNAMFRLAVGGSEPVQAKVKKLTVLARAALKRLR